MIAVGVLLVAGGVGWWAWHRQAGERRRRLRQGQLPEALERIAAALRAGASLSQALAAAGLATVEPLGPELTALARTADRGQPMIRVLDGWVVAHGDSSTRLAATALALAARIGAAPARAVDGVAATLRERHELAAERRALATQARTSAAVLSVAPLGFAAMLAVTDAAAGRFLLHSPAGWVVLGAGLGLDLAGAVWMMRLIGTAGEPTR